MNAGILGREIFVDTRRRFDQPTGTKLELSLRRKVMGEL